MKDKILVTGATGNAGSELFRLLLAWGFDVSGAGTSRERFSNMFGQDTDFVFLDFKDPATFDAALKDVDKVFLVRPPSLSDIKSFVRPFIEKCRSNNVGQIVFLSLQGVERNSFLPHYKIEKAIIDSGIGFTFLRAGFFMQNLSTTHKREIAQDSEIFIPAGKGKTSFIDVRDIARAAFVALTQPGHAGKSYELTGGEALGYAEVASLLSSSLNREIIYKNPGPIEFIIKKRKEKLPLSMILVMLVLYTFAKMGRAEKISGEYAVLTGKNPVKMAQFVEDFKTVWS